MSTSVAPAATTSGQSVQLGIDPCAVFLVLMTETEDGRSKAAPPSPPASSGNGSSGHTLDAYA